MKNKFLALISLIIVLLLVSACSSLQLVEGSNPYVNSSSDDVVKDKASFIAALTESGAEVEVNGEVEQSFFGVTGETIKVNGNDVQVYEYESKETMEADAAQVATDGGSVGTSMITWMATPHFFKNGQILALYIGEDAATVELLKATLGEQFAGR